MSTVSANQNQLLFTGIQYTEVGQWGDYQEKIKWQLAHKAKYRGYILQVVTFEYDIRWVENGQPLTPEEVFGCNDPWVHYSELWKVSANNNAPASSLNQDHFKFVSVEETYGYMKETGIACFFESTATPADLGFGVHHTCPAGIYMPSRRGAYDPGDVPKTDTIEHLVHVSWNKEGTTQIVAEMPAPGA